MTDQPEENSEFVDEQVTPEDQVADTLGPSQYTSEDDISEFISGEDTGEQELPPLPDSNYVDTPIPIRIEALTTAIELHPDAPVNYVFRGEALLDEGYYAEAAADFERALALGDSLAESANWGYIYRGLADRAREGLRRCPSF